MWPLRWLIKGLVPPKTCQISQTLDGDIMCNNIWFESSSYNTHRWNECSGVSRAALASWPLQGVLETLSIKKMTNSHSANGDTWSLQGSKEVEPLSRNANTPLAEPTRGCMGHVPWLSCDMYRINWFLWRQLSLGQENQVKILKTPNYRLWRRLGRQHIGMLTLNQNQVRLETASVACCGTPAGSVNIDVDVLRCRRDVSTPTHHHAYSLHPSTASRYTTTGNT